MFSSEIIAAYPVGYGPRVNTYRFDLTNLKDVITGDVVPATHFERTTIFSRTTCVNFTIGPTSIELESSHANANRMKISAASNKLILIKNDKRVHRLK